MLKHSAVSDYIVLLCVTAHLDAKKAGDLSTLFDVGGIVGMESHLLFFFFCVMGGLGVRLSLLFDNMLCGWVFRWNPGRCGLG